MKFQSAWLSPRVEVRSIHRRWITVTQSKCVCNMRFPPPPRDLMKRPLVRFSWPVDQDTPQKLTVSSRSGLRISRASVLRPVSHGSLWESSRIWSQSWPVLLDHNRTERQRGYFQNLPSKRADANYYPSAAATKDSEPSLTISNFMFTWVSFPFNLFNSILSTIKRIFVPR